jgi:hypothetical protein
MPNSTKIQLMLAGAFMPDYYSSLATHFFNIWVEFEPSSRYNMSDSFRLEHINNHYPKVY